MRYHTRHRRWLLLFLALGLLALPAAAAQPASGADGGWVSRSVADDSDTPPGQGSRVCAKQRTQVTVNSGRPEEYLWRVCVAVDPPPTGPVGTPGHPQRVRAELIVDTHGGHVRSVQGVLRVCRGDRIVTDPRTDGNCINTRSFSESAPATPATISTVPSAATCADPASGADTDPYYAVLTNFRLLGSADSGLDIDFSDQAIPAFAFGEISPTTSAAACSVQ